MEKWGILTMKDILIQSSGFCFIIFLGYLMKRLGFLSKADGGVLSVIIVNITLPATVIVTLATINISTTLLFLMAMGLLLNTVNIFFCYITSKKRLLIERKFQMYAMSGYNIGNFSLPFVQGFFPIAIPFLVMFDIGNSVMLTGGSTLLIDKLVDQKEETTIKKIIITLFKSVPFTVYMVMLILRGIQFDLPDSLITILHIIAKANGFLSMFMIGLYFEVRLPRRALQLVGKTLFWRYICGGIAALIFAFLIPLDPLVKIVLVLLCVAPMPTFSVINSVKAGMSEEVVGFSSSLSILISLFLMTLVMILMT